jgi:hypothetical protein
MTKRIEITDFSFKPFGYGHYNVTYTSPSTGKQFATVVNCMPLIDVTKNADKPKQKHLQKLKKLCKSI